jgi:hypothetical protein
MWLDGFLSVALVVICVIASPILATVGVAHRIRFGLALAAIGCAVLLAAFGAITAVVLMLRMQAGQYLLPVALRLPLPAPMRPRQLAGARPQRRRRWVRGVRGVLGADQSLRAGSSPRAPVRRVLRKPR